MASSNANAASNASTGSNASSRTTASKSNGNAVVLNGNAKALYSGLKPSLYSPYSKYQSNNSRGIGSNTSESEISDIVKNTQSRFEPKELYTLPYQAAFPLSYTPAIPGSPSIMDKYLEEWKKRLQYGMQQMLYGRQ